MNMRKIQIMLFSLVALFFLSACTLENDSTTPGKLAGMWHCVYIDKGAASVELKDKKVYWSFHDRNDKVPSILKYYLFY